MVDLTTHDDDAARLELSRQATLEITKLAEAASKICKDEDQPIFHGIMARITTLSDVIYYAQRLYGDSEGSEPDIQALQRVFRGFLA